MGRGGRRRGRRPRNRLSLELSSLPAVAPGEGHQPLTVLLLGRLHPRRAGGGVARSGKLITSALRSVGDTVYLVDSRDQQVVPPGTNIMLHYSDLNEIEIHIQAAKLAGVPLLVNSTYDGSAQRSDQIVKMLKMWQRLYKKVKLFVFSIAAKDDLVGGCLSHQDVVVIPKTINTAFRTELPSFEERQGICLGELIKASKSRIVGNSVGAKRAVQLLQQAAPEASLWFYNQYGTELVKPPPGAQLQQYLGRKFVDWLGHFRLYISLVRHETFAMVPAEAQSMGTVTIYREQPQSLNEHLAFTGVSFSTPEELVCAVRTLYYDKALWEQYSQMSRHNAEARCHRHVGAAIDMALRKSLL